MDITITIVITEVIGFVGVICAILARMSKIAEGTKCQLRSEMLRIYHHHKGSQTMRQYEHENFVLLYEAYKALNGNSFIDKIYKEVQTWKVES